METKQGMGIALEHSNRILEMIDIILHVLLTCSAHGLQKGANFK